VTSRLTVVSRGFDELSPASFSLLLELYFDFNFGDRVSACRWVDLALKWTEGQTLFTMLKLQLKYINRVSKRYQRYAVYAHRCWCEVDLDLFGVGASFEDGDGDLLIGLVKFVAK
jgi:hypothetical protein